MTATIAALHNSTSIDNAGIANQGTRLQVTISNIPAGAFVLVPEAIFLTNGTCSATVFLQQRHRGSGQHRRCGRGRLLSGCTPGTTAAAAALTYTPLPSTGMAVYEVLFADPFSIETATVAASIVTYTPNLNLNQPSPATTAQAFGGFAPFYSTAAAAIRNRCRSPAYLPIPRFAPGTVPANPNFFES